MATSRETGQILYDAFDALGLTRADNNTTGLGNDKYKTLDQATAQYMEIRLVESDLLQGNENNKQRIIVSLPFDHSKSINESLNARVENTWASKNSNVLGAMISNVVQNVTTDTNIKTLGDLGTFLKENTLFKYDAGSTQKSLQLPFILPLALASKEKLYDGAAVELRKILNGLEGLLYPGTNLNFFPPLMELTLGGLYRSFFGFVTGVQVTPSHEDMFMDPCTGQYFNMVYEGTLTFQNLFIYYHDNTTDSHFNLDNKNGAQVLFGDDALEDKQVYNQYALTSVFNAGSGGASSVAYFGDDRMAVFLADVMFADDSSSRLGVSSNRKSISTNPSDGNTSIYSPAVFGGYPQFANAIRRARTRYQENAKGLQSKVSELNKRLIDLEQKYIKDKEKGDENGMRDALNVAISALTTFNQ